MVTNLFAGIVVLDRNASIAWYERLAGRAPDLIPNEYEAAWRMNETGWIYVIADAERAGSALNTLLVDDLEVFLADVQARGVTTGAIETIEGAARYAVITDSDGNRLKVGQPLPASTTP
jgi:predicted enzyme related to lactoylglutathione lyase